MSGYIFVMGHCIACKALITFNPNLVPSIRVDGEKEPLCRACAERWRKIHNRPDVVIHPDAYEAGPA